MSAPRRRLTWALVAITLAAGGLLAAPATTRQGIDFAVSTKTIPLYAKALAFLHRDAEYRLLAREITAHAATDEAKALAVFDWTRRHIARTPPGWPVVDDHILHIIIRGHGLEDQMADVFTTLTTYAGVRAFWRQARVDERPGIVCSFVKLGNRWAVFDVGNGIILRMPDGQLADVRELQADPALREMVCRDLRAQDTPYAQFLAALPPFETPHPFRAEQQMPWPRLISELQRVMAASPSAMRHFLALRARSPQRHPVEAAKIWAQAR